jgi:hypothetical protein
MNQKQILPALEVNYCPFKHNDLCSRKWSAKFINHEIICNCECHRKQVLGRDEALPNTLNSPLNRNGEYEYQ